MVDDRMLYFGGSKMFDFTKVVLWIAAIAFTIYVGNQVIDLASGLTNTIEGRSSTQNTMPFKELVGDKAGDTGNSIYSLKPLEDDDNIYNIFDKD